MGQKNYILCDIFKHITITNDNGVMAGAKWTSQSTYLAPIFFTWHLGLAARLTLLSTSCFLLPSFSQPILLCLPLDPSRLLVPSVWHASLSSPWFVSILHNSGEWLISNTFLPVSCHAREVFFHQNCPELALGLNHASWGIESWSVAWFSTVFTTESWSHW